MVSAAARSASRRYGRLTASKEYPADAIAKSAIVPQQIVTQQAAWDALGTSLMWAAAGVADGISPWGTAIALRDRQLRQFITTEPYAHSAIATVIARNVGLSWLMDGPTAAVTRSQDVLHSSQFGAGVEELFTKLGWDYQTQDKGAIAELVRDENDPRAPVIGINQLDAGRCWHTGNPGYPVLYQDRLGRWHAMAWYQCLRFTEMPAPQELLYGQQYSSLTRMLTIAQTMRNIVKMHEEKTGGRFTTGVKIVSGIRKGEVEGAMVAAGLQMDSMGMARYGRPTVLTTTDPKAEPKLLELDLAKMPDGFELEDNFRWYLTLYAMALFIDYSEIAPMPGNKLGSATEVQTQHRKSRSKGIAIWTNKIEHQFNFFGVFPRNVSFRFDDKDLDEDQARAEVMKAYSDAFSQLLSGGVIDAEAAQQMLLDVGLLEQDIYDEMLKRMAAAAVEQKRLEDQMAQQLQDPNNPANLDPNAPANPNDPRSKVVRTGPRNTTASDDTSVSAAPRTRGESTAHDTAPDTELGRREMTGKLDAERIIVEDRLTKDAQRALSSMGRELRRRLEQ